MGSPTALSRPRFAKNHVYDPQKEHKIILSIELARQHDDMPMLTGPQHLFADFFMPLSIHKPIRLEGTYCECRPDLDNLVKLLCDICTGVLYADDNLVVRISTCKRYSRNPRTEFYFERAE
jgi:Holliday junction resolvase RusA-like endonuclease